MTGLQRNCTTVAYPYATTVQSSCVFICNDCTELLVLHTCSIPLFLVSAAISLIVLFVAILRLWPVLETRDDLANDNGQPPISQGQGARWPTSREVSVTSPRGTLVESGLARILKPYNMLLGTDVYHS